MHIYTHTNAYTYIYTNIHTYAYMHIHIHAHTYIYKHTHRGINKKERLKANMMRVDLAPGSFCVLASTQLNGVTSHVLARVTVVDT